MSKTDETPNARPDVMRRTSNDPWWLELSRRQKNEWIARPNTPFNGDLPPLILPERDGQLLAYIIAPIPNKNCCFMAAYACRRGLACDGLTVVTDGVMPLGDYIARCQQRLAKGTYRHGDLQRLCATENACERRLLTKCLVIYRCGRSGAYSNHILTYKAHGSGGKFEWTPQHDAVVPPGAIGGKIPDVLQTILAKPSMMDANLSESVFHKRGSPDSRKISADKLLYLCSKGTLRLLREQGFTVHDFLDAPIALEGL